MKLKDEFIVHKTEKESVLVPVGGAGFSGIIKGNAVLGDLLNLLLKDTTEEKLIAAMLGRYNAPENVITKDVKAALDQLRAIGALDE